MFAEDIIYEDRDIIVVNKPAGMPTQASEKKKGPNLYEELHNFLNKREGKFIYLALHHRLDAATSGLVLFCKNKKLNRQVTDLFREKKITKKYLAMVDLERSLPSEKEWIIENSLIEYKFKHYKKAKSSKKGKKAFTKFKVLKENESAALIECFPATGRLHQIRVHLSEAGFPVQGDFHYNKNFKGRDFKLCAYAMSFKHPRTQKELSFKVNSDMMKE